MEGNSVKGDSGDRETLREGSPHPGQRAQDSDQSKPGKALGGWSQAAPLPQL